jgi:hypothetical protein
MDSSTGMKGHAELLRRIGEVGARWKRRRAATGAMRVFTFFIGVSSLYLFLDSFWPLPPRLRAVWIVGALALLVVGGVAWVLAPLGRRIDAVRTAAAIEREHPELGELLESAAELGAKRGRGRTGYSVELIDALIAKAISDSSGVDLSATGRARDRARWLRAFALTAVFCAIGLVAAGGRLGPALERAMKPLNVPDYEITRIHVAPGDARLVSGEDLTVTAGVTGPRVGTPTLRYAYEGERPLDRGMRALEDTSFICTLADVRVPLAYSVVVDDVESQRYDVVVVERPFVSDIRLDYEFPDYSRLASRVVHENTGDITALVGTRVGMTIMGSKPLARAWLAFADGDSVALSRGGPASFTGTLSVEEGGRYSISILDVDGLRNPDPTEYSIVAIRDESPLVRIVEPGRDMEVPRGMEMPVAVSALDDYGVRSVDIRYSVQGRAEEGSVRVAACGLDAPREVAHETMWDLTETGILPGSVLIYYAEVSDNDVVSGPKTGRSETYILRFPSMAELYSDVVDEEDGILSDLDELVEEQQTVRGEFEELREELHSEPTVDWQTQERVEEALTNQEETAESVAEMADRMSELADRMAESDRITLETLEKTEEITRLLDEVATEEMRELMEKVREAMEKLSADALSQAMERMSLTQDDYLRRLEQTLSLLRRVKAEQQLANAAARAEDLAAREQDVAEEAGGDPGSEQCDSLAAEQERLRQQAEKLRDDLEKAISDMQNVDEDAAARMQEALDEMESAGTIEKMEEAGLNLAGNKPSEAQSQCQSAASDLLALFTSLSTCQGNMSCSLAQRDRETTMRLIDELLGVSAEQEEIVSSVERRDRIPRREIVELVQKETDLIEAMSAIAERTFEQSKDSFTIDTRLLRQIAVVQSMMSNAAAKIADGGTSAGQREARRALGSVNGLVVNLLSKKQGQSQGRGSALQQLMQQLQQMAGQQQQLTDATAELQRQMERMGMGSELSRQLADIRARQGQLLEDARRLANEFGDRREILGRLDDTVEEMEETLEELGRTGASDETINRQKRILSRLLDAQRSLRRRDYTQERRSRTGETYGRTSPGDVPGSLTTATDELREDLLRAMQREYPAEYREMIRAYFDGLAKDVTDGRGP